MHTNYQVCHSEGEARGNLRHRSTPWHPANEHCKSKMFNVNWCICHHTPVLEIATACGLAMTNLIHYYIKLISIFSYILRKG